MNIKKTILSTSIITILGLSATARAATIDFSFSGLWTFTDGAGFSFLQNSDQPKTGPYYQYRTPISGTVSFDTDNGTGDMTVAPFSLFGSGLLETKNISMVRIGDGVGGPGNLILGNMVYDWNATIGIPVSIVWDATGLLGATDAGLSTSDTVTGGALPATDAHEFDFGFFGTYTIPIGSSPLATTTFNTTNVGAAALGINPSGTLPLVSDTVGGSPIIAGPFKDFNFNYDITMLHVVSITQSAVPVPAAVWLFGSGLIGLIGMARRRR